MRGLKKIWNSKWWWAFFVPLLIAINWVASVKHTRIDLTNEKRFTISKDSRTILRSMEEPVRIEVLLKGEYPGWYKRISSVTQDFLSEAKEIAGLNLQYKFVSPSDTFPGMGISYAEKIENDQRFFDFLQPINLTSQLKEGQQQSWAYPIAIVHYKDTFNYVSLLPAKVKSLSDDNAAIVINSIEAMMEYKIVNAIGKITKNKKPIIGYAIGNGEPVEYETFDMVENAIKPNYDFFTVNLLGQSQIPKEMNALLLVKPKEKFGEYEKLKLDQYIMNGGKVFMCIDRLDAETDSLEIKNEVIAYDRGLNIEDQLFKYGVRINTDLIMDLQCDYLPFDISGNGQFELLPWNYFPLLNSANNHSINKNLGLVSGRFVNSIDTVDAKGIRKTVLLYSSPNARKIGTPALISGAQNVIAPQDQKYRTPDIPAAVLLEGKFSSLYANRLTAVMNDSIKKNGGVFKSVCAEDNKMIVVSDGDIVLNEKFNNIPTPMGTNKYTFDPNRSFTFSNKDFLLNCLDYLVDENGIIEAKSKDYTPYLLDAKKTESEKYFWQSINIIVPVSMVVIFAAVFVFVRKRKFT
ncbi:MAG: gliding motility-associated ABC transporter substrate-binding protein GldG [Ferruginibacter sp.]|nr:gliding motility-associated ABC transporter substrate-binding protein GldG [Ferruginibacter sp.]